MGGKKGNLDDCKDGEKQKENIDASIFSSNRKNAVPVESDELSDYNGLQEHLAETVQYSHDGYNGQNTAFCCSLPNVVSSLDDPEECTSISSGFSAMSIVTTFCLWLCNCLVAIQEGYFSSAREESAQIQTLSQISTIKSEKQSLQNSGSKVLLKWIRDLSYVSSRETPWWIFGIHSVDNLSLGLFLHGATGKMAIKRGDVNPPQPSTREISSVPSTSRTYRLIDDANFPGGSDCTQSNFCRQVVEKTTMKTNEVMLLETKQVNIQCLWTTLQNIKQAHLDVKDAYFVLERSPVVYVKKNSVLVICCSRISTHGGDCTVSQLFCLAIRKATFNGGKEIKVVILNSYTSHSTMKTRFMIKESCVEKMSVGGQLESMRYCHALIIPNLNDVTSVGPDIAKANEVNDGGAKGYIRNVGGFQRIDRLNICDVSKTITVKNGGVGRSGWVNDDEVGRIKQAKIDSVCGTDEEHDGYFGRTAETIDDVGGTVRVHDDVGRTAEVCDGSVGRTGEVYNDVGRFAKVYDGDIGRTVNLHDGNVGRTVEVLDGNVGRTALVHDGNVGRTAEVHDGNVKRTIKVHDGNVGRTVEVHDGNVERTAEVHDSVASNGGGGDAGTKGGGSSDCCPGVAIGSRNGSAAGSPSIGSACCRRRGGGGNGDEDDPDKPDRKKLPDGTPCSRNVKSGKSKTEERKAEVSPGNRAASSADTVDTVGSGYREESGSGDGCRIQANMTQDELAIVEQIQHHPNIVKFSITEKKLNGRWEKVVEKEQRDKSLLAYRDKLVDGILDILEGMFYWRQIVDVFVYLHKHDLVYKDLKLANVYLANPHLIRAELAIFNSQEFLIVKEKGCMKEQNIRSLGRLLLELVIPGANSQSEQHSIEMLKKDSPSLGFLIQSCLQEDPRKRPTAEQLSQNAAVQVFDNPEPTVFLWSPTQSEL